MIVLGLILGLLIYFGLKLKNFPGTIPAFFNEKNNMIAAVLSVLTTVAMALSVDWSSVEAHITVADIPILYGYVIAVIIGLGNSTLFFSLLKKKQNAIQQ
jgi:hypothetical protein